MKYLFTFTILFLCFNLMSYSQKYVSYKTITASKNSYTGKYLTDSEIEMKMYISFSEDQVTLFCEELQQKIQVIKFKDKVNSKDMSNGIIIDTYSGYYVPDGDLIQITVGYVDRVLNSFAISNRNVLVSYTKIESL